MKVCKCSCSFFFQAILEVYKNNFFQAIIEAYTSSFFFMGTPEVYMCSFFFRVIILVAYMRNFVFQAIT